MEEERSSEGGRSSSYGRGDSPDEGNMGGGGKSRGVGFVVDKEKGKGEKVPGTSRAMKRRTRMVDLGGN